MIENPAGSETTSCTVILAKGDMLGALGLTVGPDGARVASIDPRRKELSVRVHDDPAAARREFGRGLRTTKGRGWTIVYDGQPLRG